MAEIFENKRTYVLGDPELEIIGSRELLAQWRHRMVGPAWVSIGRKITYLGSDLNAWIAANRAENSHLPFRRRERAMLRFRRMRSLQKFVSVHSSIRNHFNQERHLYSRDNFKLNRNAALSEWRQLCSA